MPAADPESSEEYPVFSISGQAGELLLFGVLVIVLSNVIATDVDVLRCRYAYPERVRPNPDDTHNDVIADVQFFSDSSRNH